MIHWPWNAVVILIAMSLIDLTLFGCATVHGKNSVKEAAGEDARGKTMIYHNLGLRVDILKHSAVVIQCGAKNDIACEWTDTEGQDRIVTERSCAGAKAITHELAHADGADENVAATYEWPDDQWPGGE